MATVLAGVNSYVYVSGSAVALVDSYSVNIEVQQLDATSMDGTTWQKSAAGFKKATGTIKVHYATDDAAGQTILQNNVLGGSAVVIKLNPTGTATGFSGSAFLSLAVDAAKDSLVSGTYNFNSHGVWTYA